MRKSRKAGLFDRGVKWIKYACTRKYELVGRYPENIGGWERVSSGTDATARFEGWSDFDYKWDTDTSQYIYEGTGFWTYCTVDHIESVYIADGTSLYRWSMQTTGFWEKEKLTCRTCNMYDYRYYPGDKIGFVRAVEGEYPSAKNGYTYVATKDKYTIMTDGAGNYYAYKRA